MRPLARTVAVAVALFSVLAAAAQAAPPSIYADGLDAPRGLTFGPDARSTSPRPAAAARPLQRTCAPS